jgi:hypothetical protein
MGILGANLGALGRTAPLTVMDARGHVHGDDRVRGAEWVTPDKAEVSGQVDLRPSLEPLVSPTSTFTITLDSTRCLAMVRG